MSGEAHNLKGRPGQAPLLVAPFWAVVLVVWMLLLWVLPDPRPLAAPEWAVQRAQSWVDLSEPTARAVVTFLFRAAGIAVLGMLLSLALSRLPIWRAGLFTLIGAPFVAVVVKWMNFGYFPITPQLTFIVTAAVAGALAGLALRRSRMALVVLGLLGAGVFAWGTSTRIADDLYEAARITGQHVVERFSEIPDDADSFARLTELAFAYAEDNSHGVDPVFPNQAAILALGVILGDDRVATVGRREVYPGRAGEREALRRRVRVHERGDLSQHFWVSAAFTVLSDAGRALTVGIAKEMKDSTPGGLAFPSSTWRPIRRGFVSQLSPRRMPTPPATCSFASRRVSIPPISFPPSMDFLRACPRMSSTPNSADSAVRPRGDCSPRSTSASVTCRDFSVSNNRRTTRLAQGMGSRLVVCRESTPRRPFLAGLQHR